jgi:hypothetical protein
MTGYINQEYKTPVNRKSLQVVGEIVFETS